MIIDVRRQGLDGLEQRLHALSLVLVHGVGDERGDGFEHDELLKRLRVDEGPDGLDVDRCAENAAQREDEYGHGAALLITW